MKLAIMQPYFFPYIGYFQGISAVDKYILYDQVAYIKRGWVHRNRYLALNGAISYFIAKGKDKSSLTKMCDIELLADNHWRKKISKSILLNYGSRPYFDEIYPIFEDVINADVNRLSDLAVLSIMSVCKYLEIKTEVSNDMTKFLELEEKLAHAEDFRTIFPEIHLTNNERKVVRVLEICRIENATTFINAIGGQGLYQKNEFKANNIDLLFVQTRPFTYEQPTSDFHPNLSIIDVLMNCGKEGTQKLLNEYDLI